MRRGVLGLDLLPGVGDPMCPWKIKSNGDYEWERCSSDCKVVGGGGSQPGQGDHNSNENANFLKFMVL